MGLTHTNESKVMVVWICREFTCSMSSISINYALESDIQVKCYYHSNFLTASLVHFRVSSNIMGLTYTPESKVMAVWISRELRVEFQASRYIMRLNRRSEWNVMTFEFLESFHCSFSSVSIYYGPHTHKRVKSYGRLNLLRAFCWVSSVLIYYALESEIRVKCIWHLYFSRASFVHFRASRYIMGLTDTPKSKVMVVWICRELTCSIASISIYYAQELEIQVKS